MKKYEFTGETKDIGCCILHRIKALKDFGEVKKGSLGGWIEKEENLSQDGEAWVFNNAKVYDDALVCDDASVRGEAEVSNNAQVFGNAFVSGKAQVYDYAKIYGKAWVYDNSQIYDEAEVCGNAMVCDNARVYGEAEVYGSAHVYGEAWVHGDASVCGDADVYGDAKLCAHKEYTLGNFIGGDDSGKIADITKQTGSNYCKHQYVLGDYEINDKNESDEKQVEQKDTIIELDGKKYKLTEIDG